VGETIVVSNATDHGEALDFQSEATGNLLSANRAIAVVFIVQGDFESFLPWKILQVEVLLTGF
jgi:hypothetical protein